MGGPIQKSQMIGAKTTVEIGAPGGGKIGIPLIAEGKADLKAAISRESSNSTTETFTLVGIEDIVSEIGNSNYVVFIDDFHYIEKDVREDIGKQIKAAAERGIRICTASVPHRSDDVVRSNTELRGRFTAIDMTYWSPEELKQIAHLGFSELNVDLAPRVLVRLANESFGSPQLMQAICLNFCFDRKTSETLLAQGRIEVDDNMLSLILERTSTATDFSIILSTLHAGPKLRGTERKAFTFLDGSVEDVYRCVLLAINSDPPNLSFRHDEMLKRTRDICTGDSPAGSSVSESISQMSKLAKTIQIAPVIEWDEDVFDIAEPYFLFFLRCSPYLARLAKLI
jgi:hypothetical protein